MSEEKKNTNCLDGLKCPKCGSLGPYGISVRAFATVSDDGTDEFDGVEWEDDSYCGCMECNFKGEVRNFFVPKQEG
jgi:hypothetical protein